MGGTRLDAQVLEPLEAVQGVLAGSTAMHSIGRGVLLQAARAAHHGAGRAQAGDEVREPVADRGEDLAARAVVVRAAGSTGLEYWSG